MTAFRIPESGVRIALFVYTQSVPIAPYRLVRLWLCVWQRVRRSARWMSPSPSEGSVVLTQAAALEKHAAKGVKVVVVANPANTNALILSENAPSIPKCDISCLTRLDHNRALGQISQRLQCAVSDVRNVIIWGNHSSSQYPDVNHGTVTRPDGLTLPIRTAVCDDAWLQVSCSNPLISHRYHPLIYATLAVVSSRKHRRRARVDRRELGLPRLSLAKVIGPLCPYRLRGRNTRRVSPVSPVRKLHRAN